MIILSVYIMTVHKSKGLEYDTVIMPAMGHSLAPKERTSILLGKIRLPGAFEQCSDEEPLV